MLRVTFLGTGGSVPQTHRNPSAVMVEREGDRLLFDCGEGTQRQMMKYGTGFTVDALFISHIHGDHILGIPGLMQTWTFQDRREPVDVYCPTGTLEVVRDCVGLAGHNPSYDVRYNELKTGEEVSRDEYTITSFATEHEGMNSLGYSLVEDERKGEFDRERAEELGVPPGPMYSKLHRGENVELEDGTVVESEEVVGEPRPGRKVVYTGDTRPTNASREAATDANLLIHDGMFDSGMGERARRTGHSTAGEAAELANEAGAELLALTHISSRYSDGVTALEQEARDEFPNTVIAYDGMKVVVEFPEKNRETRVVE